MKTVLCRRELLRNATAALAGLLAFLGPWRSAAGSSARPARRGVGAHSTPEAPHHAAGPDSVYTYDVREGRESALCHGPGSVIYTYEWHGRVTRC